MEKRSEQTPGGRISLQKMEGEGCNWAKPKEGGRHGEGWGSAAAAAAAHPCSSESGAEQGPSPWGQTCSEHVC